MTINRNYLFLEAFSVVLVLSMFGDIQEFVATLISNHPQDYLYYLTAYIIVISILLFIIYKVTYKPPKYEKIVNKAQQRHNSIMDGLKTKIDTIDDKKRKKEEKERKKAVKSAQKEESKSQKQKTLKKEPSSTTLSYKTIPQNTGSKHKSTPKPKTTRRRR